MKLTPAMQKIVDTMKSDNKARIVIQGWARVSYVLCEGNHNRTNARYNIVELLIEKGVLIEEKHEVYKLA